MNIHDYTNEISYIPDSPDKILWLRISFISSLVFVYELLLRYGYIFRYIQYFRIIL